MTLGYQPLIGQVLCVDDAPERVVGQTLCTYDSEVHQVHDQLDCLVARGQGSLLR